MIGKFFCVFVLQCFLLSVCGHALANRDHNEKRHDVSFVEAAISESTWSDYLYSGYRRQSPHWPDHVERLTLSTPYFVEYISRSKGFPKPHALNKWPDGEEIFVSVNWPEQRGESWDRFPKLNPYDSYSGASDDTVRQIEDEVERILPELSGILSNPISLLRKESPERFSRIRLLLVPSDFFNRGTSKLIRYNPNEPKPFGADARGFARYIERSFLGAIPFTPFSDVGVDGYLLTNSENRIEFAHCYIDHQQIEARRTIDIKECLLRSLGIPDDTSDDMKFRDAPHKVDGVGTPQYLSLREEAMVRRISNPDLQAGFRAHEIFEKTYWQNQD